MVGLLEVLNFYEETEHRIADGKTFHGVLRPIIFLCHRFSFFWILGPVKKLSSNKGRGHIVRWVVPKSNVGQAGSSAGKGALL